MESDRLITVRETASRLNVSRDTVYKLIRDEMPALRIGGSIRIDPVELRRWLYYEAPGGTPGPDAPAMRRAPDDASPAVEARQLAGGR
jgi:excisionase family DNA binding protein